MAVIIQQTRRFQAPVLRQLTSTLDGYGSRMKNSRGCCAVCRNGRCSTDKVWAGIGLIRLLWQGLNNRLLTWNRTGSISTIGDDENTVFSIANGYLVRENAHEAKSPPTNTFWNALSINRLSYQLPNITVHTTSLVIPPLNGLADSLRTGLLSTNIRLEAELLL